MSASNDQTKLPSSAGTQRSFKSASIIKLLTRARGATLAEMREATDWQRHSVRAHLSGLRKRGQVLLKEERKSGETAYRFAATGAATIEGSTNDG